MVDYTYKGLRQYIVYYCLICNERREFPFRGKFKEHACKQCGLQFTEEDIINEKVEEVKK